MESKFGWVGTKHEYNATAAHHCMAPTHTTTGHHTTLWPGPCHTTPHSATCMGVSPLTEPTHTAQHSQHTQHTHSTCHASCIVHRRACWLGCWLALWLPCSLAPWPPGSLLLSLSPWCSRVCKLALSCAGYLCVWQGWPPCPPRNHHFLCCRPL